MTLDPDDRRLLELQLLHHYTSVVIQTIPSSEDQTMLSIYRKYAIDMCWENPVLLNATLALSAWHLVCMSRGSDHHSQPASASTRPYLAGPIDADKAYHFYLTTAVNQQREAIANLDRVNKDALIVATALLSYQTLGFWSKEAKNGDTGSYSPPIHWLRMAKGIAVVAKAAVPDGEGWFLHFMISKVGKPNFRDPESIFVPEDTQPFLALLDFESCPEPNLDPQSRLTYDMTLRYIGGIYRGIQENEPPSTLFRRLLCLGIMVPEQFLDFIDERRPRALAMLALYCSTAASLDYHWMFHGMAERGVKGLQTLLPPEWQWSMSAPLSIMESCLSKEPGTTNPNESPGEQDSRLV